MHWNIHVHQLSRSVGPLKLVGGLFSSKWQTFQFFFYNLDCGENIVNFVLLSRVLPMHLHRSCSLHQSSKVVVDATRLFSDSSASIIVSGHNQRHHSHTTLEPPKKTSSLTRYFAATCSYEFSSVLRITTYWLRATMIAGKLRSRRVGHINGLMFAPALLMQFLKRYIGVYAEVVD